MADKRRCGSQTLSGHPCNQILVEGQERCWQHRGPQCSVCLSCIGGQSKTRKLDCTHEFHEKCLTRWKASCTGPDPTCPMCRTPFDVPSYRCRLIIERTSDASQTTTDFESSNINEIMSGFGIDLRQLVPGQGRFLTDIHFDIDVGESLEEVLRELGLPEPR